jgi:hypothetical protein
MSIIMAGARLSSSAAGQPRYAEQIDPNLRELLDHIAVELAEEYVRLMEAAAEVEPRDQSERGAGS